MITYEQQLNRDTRWALQEGSMHFEQESAVHKSLRRIVQRLETLGVPFAVAGGMALFFHGYRRFTEDVDVIVTRDALRTIHEELEGRGYLPPFTGSKNLRDAESGVRIEFIVSGDYPGDGKPKPIQFPDPSEVRTTIDGIPCLRLVPLIELKLASGMTNPGRLKDLADVQELIRLLNLPAELTDQLHPFVREKYTELWNGTREE